MIMSSGYSKISICSICPNGDIIPIHSIDHEIFAIDYQFMSIAASGDRYKGRPGQIPMEWKEDQQKSRRMFFILSIVCWL